MTLSKLMALPIGGLVGAAIAGCTGAGARTSVKIQLPEKLSSSAARAVIKTVAAGGATTQWGFNSPTSGSDTDCYAVFVQAPDLAQSTCTDLSGATVATVSSLYGLYAAGSSISIDMLPGAGRTIGVWALSSANGTCSGNIAVSPGAYSAPLYIGSTKVEIAGATVNANISASFTNVPKIERCSGGDLGTWPPTVACTPSIKKVSLNSNKQLLVEGSCLDQTSGAQLTNVGSATMTPLTVVSQTATAITAAVAANLSMSVGQAYRIFLPPAGATTTGATATLNLVLSSVKTLKDHSGVVIGTLTGDPNPKSTNLNVRLSGGGLASYAIQLDGSLKLSGFIWSVPSGFSTAAQATQDRYLPSWQMDPSYTTYYSGTNCTGNILVVANGYPGIFGGTYVTYQSCVTGGNCTPVTARVTNSTASYNANLAFASSTAMGQCQNYSGTVNGYDVGAPIPLDSTDPAALAVGWAITE